MTQQQAGSLRRLQVLAITVVGAIAVIAFVISLIIGTDDGAGSFLRTVAYVAAGVCAVVGVTFALTEGKR